MTPGLLKSINHKNDKYKQFKQDLIRYKEQFQKCYNFLKLLIKTTKLNYYNEKINQNKNNIKSLEQNKKYSFNNIVSKVTNKLQADFS